MTRRTKKNLGGRPPLFGVPMNRVNVVLSDEDLQRAAKVGGGNVSHGIRVALERVAGEQRPKRKRNDE